MTAHLPTRIVAAVDATTDDPIKARVNDVVIDVAARLASVANGTVTLFQAWRPSGEHFVLELGTTEEIAMYVERTRLRAQWHLARLCRAHELNTDRLRIALLRGPVEAALPRFVVAEAVDLVVIGSTGRGGLARRFLGSTAERLMRRVSCSTLVVKPQEHEARPSALAPVSSASWRT